MTIYMSSKIVLRACLSAAFERLQGTSLGALNSTPSVPACGQRSSPAEAAMVLQAAIPGIADLTCLSHMVPKLGLGL